MICKKCLHLPVCDMIRDDVVICNRYIDKSQIVELPMSATEELRKELTEYCRKRCIEEL